MTLTVKQYYTYKVTFPGTPWYYYGFHKHDGKPYYGSPVTHRRIWDIYECEVQILEWFETLQEAQDVESRIIRQFLNDPDCLNEHCGGLISDEARRRGGRTSGVNTYQSKTGCHSPDIPRGGENHPMFGKKHTDSAKQKMSEAHQGPKNSFFGKSHTNETKTVIAEKARQRMNTAEAKQRHSEKMKGRSWWSHPGGKTMLSFECPGNEWVKGRVKV